MELYFLDAQRDRTRVEAVWRSLIATGNYSYFLSWAWVETWLDTLRERGLPLELAVVRDADGDVAAFFLGRRKRIRHGMISSRTLFFNATGDRAVDRLYIEYNAIPCRRQISGGLERLLGLLPKNWDELVLPGLDPAQFPGSVLAAGAGQRRTVYEKRQPAHAVDLERVRACGGDYLSLLGPTVRSQIRRSQRLYREMGEARLEAASSVGEALAAFDEMLELHRDAWARRGRRSNFDTPYVSGFHRSLIERRFAAGEIELLRLRVGNQAVGCLYNLRYQGRVYCYQSGFRLDADNRLKPGLVCHAEAVQRSAREGERWYDFLAGDDRYKVSLATDSYWLSWVTVQQPRVLLSLERWARAAWQRRRGQGEGPEYEPAGGTRRDHA
jgi:CelD/BcsL family acetyltransferase involved in cellulose biosynthesis